MAISAPFVSIGNCQFNFWRPYSIMALLLIAYSIMAKQGILSLLFNKAGGPLLFYGVLYSGVGPYNGPIAIVGESALRTIIG